MAPLQAKKRSLILYRVAAVLALAASTASSSTLLRPNVVLVVLDDVGWADAGWTQGDAWSGPNRETDERPPSATPHMDALARRGVRLTSFYVRPCIHSFPLPPDPQSKHRLV